MLVGACLLASFVLSFGYLQSDRVLDHQDLRLVQQWSKHWTKNLKVPGERLLWATDQVLLVWVDERTLEYLNSTWPVPRDVYAQLVKKLKTAGVDTIALDFTFFDPADPNDPKSVAESLALSEALAQTGVIAAYSIEPGGAGIQERLPHVSLFDAEQNKERLGFVSSWSTDLNHGFPLAVEGFDGRIHYQLTTVTVAEHLKVDPEVLLAKLPLHQPTHDDYKLRTIYPKYLLTSSQVQDSDVQEGEFKQEQAELSALINSISAADILDLDAELLKEDFQGQKLMAIIGTNVVGGHDHANTLVGRLAGTAINTQMVINQLLGNAITPVNNPTAVLTILLPTLLLALAGAYLHYTVVTAIFFGLAGGVFFFGKSQYIGATYEAAGILYPIVAPELSLFLAGCIIAQFHYVQEQKRTRKVVDILKEVCPVSDIDELAEKGITLGGEERELTILFSDLRGYTSFAEKLDSNAVLDSLNEYFGTVGHIFEKHGGLIFDYQGDAQMVVFGLAEPSKKNHAESACRSALEMVATLKALQDQWKKQNRILPDTGIGVCTGRVSFGFMGTSSRKQQVAIGDPTNTAARLQSKSAELYTPIVLSESTVKMLDGALPTVFLEELFVKGKKEALQVYGLDMKAISKEQ